MKLASLRTTLAAVVLAATAGVAGAGVHPASAATSGDVNVNCTEVFSQWNAYNRAYLDARSRGDSAAMTYYLTKRESVRWGYPSRLCWEG